MSHAKERLGVGGDGDGGGGDGGCDGGGCDGGGSDAMELPRRQQREARCRSIEIEEDVIISARERARYYWHQGSELVFFSALEK